MKIYKFRKWIGETLVILGAGGFTYGVFNFQGRSSVGGILPSLGTSRDILGVEYYYDSEVRLLITISTMLIILGFFIIRNKNNVG